MKKYYKLIGQNMQTYRGFQWELGKWVEAKPENDNYNRSLCSDAWLHCYESPLLAILHNPIHANIDAKELRLFEVEVGGESKFDGQMKCGFRRMKLFKEIEVPKITTEQRIAYGIMCAKEVYADKKWNKWADNWLLGKDRSFDAADVTVHAAYIARAACVADVATYAAHVACVAEAIAYADCAACVACAIDAAIYATRAACVADNATRAAVYAARAVCVADVAVDISLDLIDITKKAIK